jgi:hypothetical protein
MIFPKPKLTKKIKSITKYEKQNQNQPEIIRIIPRHTSYYHKLSVLLRESTITALTKDNKKKARNNNLGRSKGRL